MSIRVVAVDMDGTFLRPDMTYDVSRFATVRERMRRAGVRFVVASGNQAQQLRSFFPPGQVDGWVCENGHFLYEQDSATPFFAAQLAPGVAETMIDVLEQLGQPYVLSAPDRAYLPAHLDEQYARLVGQYYHAVEVVADTRSVADRTVKACLWASEPLSIAAQLQDAVGAALVAVVSGPEDIDLHVPGHHKASGLAQLLQRWGVSFDEVVAFGDNHNDLELLRAAGIGVAMGNARDEVKHASDRLAPANTADGVLAVLEEMLPAP